MNLLPSCGQLPGRWKPRLRNELKFISLRGQNFAGENIGKTIFIEGDQVIARGVAMVWRILVLTDG